jgi:hypothetical protein
VVMQAAGREKLMKRLCRFRLHCKENARRQ